MWTTVPVITDPICLTELVTNTVIVLGSGPGGGAGLLPVELSKVTPDPHVGDDMVMANPLKDAGAEPPVSGLVFHHCEPQKFTEDPTVATLLLMTKAPFPVRVIPQPVVPVEAVLPPTSSTDTPIV